jgi:hypothetical protein
MSTRDQKVNIFLKKFLTQQQITTNFLDYLLKHSTDNLSQIFPDQGIFQGGLISAFGTDQFEIQIPTIGTDGQGHILNLDPTWAGVKFENENGADYHIGLRYNEIYQETEVNVRTGQIEYTFIEEQIGELAEPDAIVDNGTTLTFTIDGITEAGVSNAGRTVGVWLKTAVGQADAFFQGTVVWDGSNNKIETTHLLGQTAGLVSTDTTDYQVFLYGPTIKRNTDLSLDPSITYLGKITGSGAGTTPSVTDQRDMRVLFSCSDIGPIGDSTKMMITGGGLVTWDLSTETLIWSDTINIIMPNRSFNFNIAANTVNNLEDGDTLYFQRDETGGTKVLVKVPSNSVPNTTFAEPLVVRDGNNIYFRYGALELKGDASTTQGRINDITQDLLTFMGADSESDSDPNYSSAAIVTQGNPLVDAISELDAQLNAIVWEEPQEEHFVVVGAPQTNFIAVTMSWSPTITHKDIVVYVNGRKQRPDTGGTNLYDYRKVNGTEIEFSYAVPIDATVTIRRERRGGAPIGGGEANTASNIGTGSGQIFAQKVGVDLQMRNIKAGSGITVTQVGSDIIINAIGTGGPGPYFNRLVTNQPGSVCNIGQDYNVGTEKLDVWRNGLHLILSPTIGDAVDRYTEATNNSIAVGLDSVTDDVYQFVNMDSTPTYRNIVTGVTGTLLTIPTYVTGTNQLRVYRNGLLMNAAGLGDAVDQYIETDSTHITLAQAAVSTDVFVIHAFSVTPNFREDKTGLTGSVISLTNSYDLGDDGLLVFRNGILLFNSAILGNAADRYSETTTTSITLAEPAQADEVFTFIDK